jgi:DNA-directed RNA polymerase II subunit RPB2
MEKFNYDLDTWKVIESYLTENNYTNLIRHHLDSFNEFTDIKIEQIVKQSNPLLIFNNYDEETNSYKYEININFGNIYFNKPIIYENNGSTKLMYPNDARLRNLTYSSQLLIDLTIDIYSNENGEKVLLNNKELKKVNIGKIPIMVGSKYCTSHINSFGECDLDLGGYFLINGNEKVIVGQEKIAEQKVYVFKGSKSNLKYSHIAEVKSVSKNGFNTPKNCSIKFSNKDVLKGKTLKVNIPHCRVDIPLFIIFRAFGVESDKEIVKYILYDIENNNDKLDLLQSTIEEGSEIRTQNDALEHILKYSSILGQPKDIKLNRERKLVLFKEMMERDVLAHVGPNFKKKALFLGYMVNKLLKCYFNEIPYDDRDSYCNKRVETSGYLMALLFRQYFTKMTKDMRNQIMKELNSNPWKNSNHMNIESIINNNNLFKIIKSTTIESGIKYGLATGNWGIKSTNSKVGIAQVLNRLTYNATLSHLRRINTPTEKTGKLVPPRKLHNTQWGIVCPSETPEGGSVGLVKNIGIMTYITNQSSEEPIIKIIDECENIINIESVDNIEDTINKTKLFINGDWLYITECPKVIYEKLILSRRKGLINIYASISFDTDMNQINIYTDAGRCCRPLYIVENNKLLITKDDINNIVSKKYKFRNLIIRGLNNNINYDTKDTRKDDIGCIEYIDTEESFYKMIAVYSNLKSKTKYSHCEIHPSLMLGLLSSLIPFSNHNQSPRNTYQSAMGKQAMGVYMTNFRQRMDTMGHVLYYPTKPLVDTNIGKLVPSAQIPNGLNVIVAIASYSGYNQEDSVIINKGSVERGLFRSTFFRTYRDDEKKIQSSGQDERIMKPPKDITSGIKPGCYDKLETNGFVPINTHVTSNDIIIGKVFPIKSKTKTKYVYRDSSTFLRSNETGYIDKIYVNRNGDGHKFCKVRVRTTRVPNIGDKFSSRHGQKGTCGMLLPEEDMPFTKDGIRPDIIVNPHAIPSRMTIAQLIECILGKVATLQGGYGDGTPFNDTSVDKITKLLEQHNFEGNGNEVMYNGLNGKQLNAKIFIGPTYYQRLKHMVEDKIHSRATGPMVLLTRQPAEGRARDGGLRFGEMERDCMIAHGSVQFLKERMLDVSDNYRVFVCNECGFIAAVNPDENIYKCKPCNNFIDFSEIRIPYSCKLLIQELEGMNIASRFITN